MRRTKIVATIGPASRSPDVLVRMVEAGMDVARLNFSHADHAMHAETADRVRRAADRAGRPVAILQDLPGPKLRIGELAGGTVELKVGDRVTFECHPHGSVGDAGRMAVSWPGLVDAVAPGEVLYLADGTIRLRVQAVRHGERELDTAVEVGGSVSTRQGLNVPGPADDLPSVPAEDLEHLRAGRGMGVDVVALSFVRTAQDVIGVREHTQAPLIAKIEKPQAVTDAEAITRAADGIMVARGDLGIELPIEEVPIVQKRLLATAGRLARPSITATQMLDSMVHSPRPTRAEVADVANAILDGTDAVMLSQETAIGAFPVESVEMMSAVARHAEKICPYERWAEWRVDRQGCDPGCTIAHGAVAASRELGLDALVIPTMSGRSAQLVSAHRPTVPIYALSPHDRTVLRCNLMWGVRAAPIRHPTTTEQLIAEAARLVVDMGWCQRGDRVGITAGLPAGTPGTTSLLQVQAV